LTEIKLKKGESVDRALRRLKKKVDREGTLKVVRNHRHFEKPSEKRRRALFRDADRTLRGFVIGNL
jgi:small subunit ribosomal protein S21